MCAACGRGEEEPMYKGEEKRSGWRVNKEVTAGDLVALAVALTAVFVSYFSLSTRVSVLEVTSAQSSVYISAAFTEIKAEMKSINDKLYQITVQKPK